jgi:hypothetical protein
MQKDLETYLSFYNNKRPHQGRNMRGRTPARAFMDGLKDLKTSPNKSPNKKAA